MTPQPDKRKNLAVALRREHHAEAAAKPHQRSREALLAKGVPMCPGTSRKTGQPCAREAGWGTDHHGVGPCQYHDEAALEVLEQKKRAFIARYADQPCSLRRAAAESGVPVVTLWRLRQEDPEFDLAVKNVAESVKEVRKEMIKDAAFLRAIDPTSGADVLRIFLLQNMAPDEFSDRRRVSVSRSADGQGVTVEESRSGGGAWAIGDMTLVFGQQTNIIRNGQTTPASPDPTATDEDAADG